MVNIILVVLWVCGMVSLLIGNTPMAVLFWSVPAGNCAGLAITELREMLNR